MIITNSTQSQIKIPIVVPITANTVVTFSRGNVSVTQDTYTSSTNYITLMLPADVTVGEWNYTVGGNKGIILVQNSYNDYGEYQGSSSIKEFN